jgi:YD repeat-containing protein
VTDAEGYAVTTDYDLFDRPVRVTYPDGSYEETTYDRLDVSTRRDRAGRITRYFYDPVRRLIATRDPLGRTIRQDWCTCGAMDALVDSNGNRTTWAWRAEAVARIIAKAAAGPAGACHARSARGRHDRDRLHLRAAQRPARDGHGPEGAGDHPQLRARRCLAQRQLLERADSYPRHGRIPTTPSTAA